MISPSGKRKEPLTPTYYKHGGISNADIFSGLSDSVKTALVGLGDEKEQPGQQQDPQLQQTMNDSSSFSMNPSNIPEEGDLKKNEDKTQVPNQQAPAMQPAVQNREQQIEGQLAQQLGPRQARIVTKFIQELLEAQMIPETFMPDAMTTKFTSGGGGIELKVPGVRAGAKAVSYPGGA